ncbi:MAG TPA: phosphoenolpyruvate--protein phosphotransferase [Gemmatimonadales bacterium]
MSASGRILTGIGVSPGVVIGPALVLEWNIPDVPNRVVARDQVEGEVARLHAAVAEVRGHLDGLRHRAERRIGAEEAKIFDAQILMLEDQEFLAGVIRLIRDNQLSAERAFEFKALEMRALWARSTSVRLRERVVDLTAVQLRVLNYLLGKPMALDVAREGPDPVVVFMRELTPGLTVQFDRDTIAGFVSEEGTRTSHAAILAHSLGIPCVMGLVGALPRVRSGTRVILDGSTGRVILDPRPEEISGTQAGERRRQAFEHEIERGIAQPAVTRDGVRVELLGNVDLPEELEAAAIHGAEGVGLLRTEFLVLGRSEMPSEDEQAAYFTRVGARFPGRPVMIRSYDLGGDKFPGPLRPPPEANPFLGWRALRVCLDRPDIFRGQIRAILRARATADVRLLLPLVTQLEEVRQTKELVAEALADLIREGRPAARELPLGVMIETPAAVVLVDALAAECDFLSVGSNDLTQYTLVVDRGNARLASRFNAIHPAVVRMLQTIAEAGRRAGKPTSVCGEMASDPLAAFLLLGLGYRVLSASPTSLPLMRWLIRRLDATGAAAAAAAAVQGTTERAVREALEQGIATYVDLRSLEGERLPPGLRETSFTA